MIGFQALRIKKITYFHTDLQILRRFALRRHILLPVFGILSHRQKKTAGRAHVSS